MERVLSHCSWRMWQILFSTQTKQDKTKQPSSNLFIQIPGVIFSILETSTSLENELLTRHAETSTLLQWDLILLPFKNKYVSVKVGHKNIAKGDVSRLSTVYILPSADR